MTLYDIHQQSGLTAVQVAERMAEFEGGEARHYTSVSKILSRGTRDIDVIEALAFAYTRPRSEIEQAAKASRTEGLPEAARRRKKTASV